MEVGSRKNQSSSLNNNSTIAFTKLGDTGHRVRYSVLDGILMGRDLHT